MNPTGTSQLPSRARNKRGQTLAEYALILAFISVVAISALATLSGQVNTVFTTVDRQLTSAEIGGASGSRAPP